MVVAEITVVPVGTDGPSVSRYVKAAFESLQASGLECRLDPMGTTVEAESAGEVYDALRQAQEALFEMGLQRVYTVVKMDDRRDRDRPAEEMVRSVTGE